MLNIALSILAGLGGFAGLLAYGARLAEKAKLGTKAGQALAALPPVALHTSSPTFNEAVGAAANTIETILKAGLSGETLQAFLAFLGTSPSETAILGWLETNVGGNLVAQAEAALPALLKQEIGILGHHVPGVLGMLIAKAAPEVATAAAQQKLTAAEVLAKLTALSQKAA